MPAGYRAYSCLRADYMNINGVFKAELIFSCFKTSILGKKRAMTKLLDHLPGFLLFSFSTSEYFNNRKSCCVLIF